MFSTTNVYKLAVVKFVAYINDLIVTKSAIERKINIVYFKRN